MEKTTNNGSTGAWSVSNIIIRRVHLYTSLLSLAVADPLSLPTSRWEVVVAVHTYVSPHPRRHPLPLSILAPLELPHIYIIRAIFIPPSLLTL